MGLRPIEFGKQQKEAEAEVEPQWPDNLYVHEYHTKDGKVVPFRILTFPSLNDYLLLVDTDEQAQLMKDSGVEEVIFSKREIEEIKNLPPNSIKGQFLIKKTVLKSLIEKG